MSEIVERYERITGNFTDRVRGVPAGAWENPSPCAGWTARDVVGHLTEWIPEFFSAQGVDFPAVPSVHEDPIGAWEHVQVTIADALADPAMASRPIETPFGVQSFAETVDMIVTGDVFTHTWDLARATGQDEMLDRDQLQRMASAMGSMPEEMLRADGMFGPRIDVPAVPTTRRSSSPMWDGEPSGPPGLPNATRVSRRRFPRPVIASDASATAGSITGSPRARLWLASRRWGAWRNCRRHLARSVLGLISYRRINGTYRRRALARTSPSWSGTWLPATSWSRRSCAEPATPPWCRCWTTTS